MRCVHALSEMMMIRYLKIDYCVCMTGVIQNDKG